MPETPWAVICRFNGRLLLATERWSQSDLRQTHGKLHGAVACWRRREGTRIVEAPGSPSASMGRRLLATESGAAGVPPPGALHGAVACWRRRVAPRGSSRLQQWSASMGPSLWDGEATIPTWAPCPKASWGVACWRRRAGSYSGKSRVIY